jgi:hypothetical protein
MPNTLNRAVTHKSAKFVFWQIVEEFATLLAIVVFLLTRENFGLNKLSY